MERLVYVSDEILMSCHRSAERCIRYRLSTVQSRWQQVVITIRGFSAWWQVFLSVSLLPYGCRFRKGIASYRIPVSEPQTITCHKGSRNVICPVLTAAIHVGTCYTYCKGMEG